MLALYSEKSISSRAFGNLWLSREDTISQGLVEHIVNTLLDKPDNHAHAICVDIVEDYFCRKDTVIPEDLAFRLLTSAALIEKDLETMSGYHWYEIAKRFREQYPERDMDLFSAIFCNTRNLSRVRSISYPSRIMDEIVKNRPREAWKIISAELEESRENRYEIIGWLGDELGFDDNPQRGSIGYIDPQDVMSWIQKKPDERAKLFYDALPKTLDEDAGGNLTREFIEAFSDNDRISGALMVHFWTGGWSGPQSEYLTKKRDKARQWLSHSKSQKLQAWLSRYIQHLTIQIESARISEERE
jgi:hypothetical protein